MDLKEWKEPFRVPHAIIKMRPGGRSLKSTAIILSDPNFKPKYQLYMLCNIISIPSFLIP